jgi:hypothetical protein
MMQARLMQAYSKPRSSDMGSLAFCMLTHKYLLRKLVIGAHLWKRAWARQVGDKHMPANTWEVIALLFEIYHMPCRFGSRLGIDDINDIRNGLMLFKPLEWAFDNSKLSIVPDTTFNPTAFQVRVPSDARGACGCYSMVVSQQVNKAVAQPVVDRHAL